MRLTVIPCLTAVGLNLLLAATGLAAAPQDDKRPVVHRDPSRAFALHLEAGWRVLQAKPARTVDPEAAVVARPAEGDGFLAVEARRLPAVALSLWAVAWDSRRRPGNAVAGQPGMGPGYLKVLSFTTRRVAAGRFVISSEFRRRGGWAYRISRYFPFEAKDAVRDRLSRAADGFRLLAEDALQPDPGAITSSPHADRVLPDGGIIRDGVWARRDVAAALQPPTGWRLTPDRDDTSFLPRDLAISMHDTINGYRAGLLVLGETTRLDDLAVWIHAALAVHLRDAVGVTQLSRAGVVRVTCTSRMPRGAAPGGLPLTWLAEGRIVEGQGLAILVGVTGLGLAADRERMQRAFEAWRTPPPSILAARRVAMGDGLVFAPEAGLRWQLPATWTVDVGPNALDLREEGTLVSARRRGPGPAGDRLPPVRARVYRLTGRYTPGQTQPPRVWTPPPEFLLLGGGEIISRSLSHPPTRACRTEWAILRESSEGREWVRITSDGHEDGRGYSLWLVSCVPFMARERLAAEQEALHRSFQVTPAATVQHGALRVEDGTLTDTLRGLRLGARPGWIWLLGNHARDVEPLAIAALVRTDGEASVAVRAERLPGFTVMRWAAYQRVKRPRRMPEDRLFVEEREPDARRKSILATAGGWCLRVDLLLSDYAPSRASAEGHAVLRSFAIDLEGSGHAAPAVTAEVPNLPPGQSVANGVWTKLGCPAALAMPRGWRILSPRQIGRGFPFEVKTALEQVDFGALAALVEADGRDLEAAAARLEERLEQQLTGWRVTQPRHSTARGIELEAEALVPGALPDSSLPSRWRVRVTRVGTRMFAILTWIKGTPEVVDLAVLEAGLDALIPAPTPASTKR